MTKPLTGRCLCGAVTFTATAAPVMAGHCHCIDCRKSSGTGHCTHVMVPAESYSAKGVLASYSHPADSGNLVERYFCPTCGCAIHSINPAMPAMLAIRASSLDDPNSVTPQMIVYASRAPAWDVMDPALPSFAEMPPGGPPLPG
jgi:hypothetical protein